MNISDNVTGRNMRRLRREISMANEQRSREREWRDYVFSLFDRISVGKRTDRRMGRTDDEDKITAGH